MAAVLWTVDNLAASAFLWICAREPSRFVDGCEEQVS